MARAWTSLWRLALSVSVLVLCILLSLAGIYYAIQVSKCDSDAGRGGAIADALALLVIFLGQSYASRLFKLIKKMGPREETSGPLDRAAVRAIAQEEIDAVLTLLSRDARNQKWQNIFLALATAVGTLSWGFGDLIARAFIGHRCP